MFGQFSDGAMKTLALANQEAQRFGHEYVGGEHILMGLLKDESGAGATVLRNMGVTLHRVRSEVERLVRPQPPRIPIGMLPMTARAKKVVEYAIEQSRGLGHTYVGSEHLLLGLLKEDDGTAAQVLRNLGLSIESVREEVLKLLGVQTTSYVARSSEAARPALRAECPMCARIEAMSQGTDQSLVVQLLESFVVLGDNQGCRGWCVLILKDHAEHLADVDSIRQARVWDDVSRVAAAIRSAFPDTGKDGGPPRINYECLGNLVPHVHWHVIPRHADDPEPTKPVWGWPEARLKGTMSEGERKELIEKLRKQLAT